MSPLSDDEFTLLSRIHSALIDPFTTTLDPAIAQLRTCPADVRQLVVSHLVWLYSHWPAVPRTEVRGGSEWTQSTARRAMRVLGTCLRRLTTEEAWSVQLNPWQSHLLQHYERLAPFPLTATTQEEIIDIIWGPEWPLILDLRTMSRHFTIYDLAILSRDLGLDLHRVKAELRKVQTDGRPLRLLSVQSVCRELERAGKRVLALAGMGEEVLERPGMVRLGQWGDLPMEGIREQAGTSKDEITPSGRPRCDEKVYNRHAENLLRFGEDTKTSPPSSQPDVLISSASPRDIKPVIPTANQSTIPAPKPPSEIIDLSSTPDSPPSHNKYQSPPPSKSPPPIEAGKFEQVWEVAARKRRRSVSGEDAVVLVKGKGKEGSVARQGKPATPVYSPVLPEYNPSVDERVVEPTSQLATSSIAAVIQVPPHITPAGPEAPDADSEMAKVDAVEPEDNASRSSTTVYVSPTSETSPTSTPAQEPMSSGRRKRSVADSDDEEEGEPQKRFKGSEDTDISGVIDYATSSRSATPASPNAPSRSPSADSSRTGPRSRSLSRSRSPARHASTSPRPRTPSVDLSPQHRHSRSPSKSPIMRSPSRSPARSRSPTPVTDDSDHDGSENGALWRQVLSADPVPVQPPRPMKVEPRESRHSVVETGERGASWDRPVDTSGPSEAAVMRIVDMGIENIEVLMSGLPVGSELVLWIACTMTGEVEFRINELDCDPLTSTAQPQAQQHSAQRFAVYTRLLRNNARLLSRGKGIVLKISRAMNGRYGYALTFQSFPDGAPPWSS